MTLGEKLKQARQQAGLTQGQLAEKLSVSRSAVAKWETDKGIPDVENLKAISRMLDVSIDYLLDNGENLDVSVIREPIDLSIYEKGSRRSKKDKIVREKYPDAKINPLLAKTKLTKGEKILGNLLGFFTDAPFGTPDVINDVKNADKQYYLVERGEKQLLVMISDEFIESRELKQKPNKDKFEVGDIRFTKCTYEVE